MIKGLKFTVFCLLLFLCSGYGLIASAQIHKIPHHNIQEQTGDFKLLPVFAQFLDSQNFLKGDKDGVTVVEIESGKIVDKAVTEAPVATMFSSPLQGGGVYFSTLDGQVFIASLKDNKLLVSRLTGLEKSNLRVIKSILVHPKDPSRILFVDNHNVVLCRIDGSKIKIDKELHAKSDDSMFTFATPDHRDFAYFIVDAAAKDRFRGNWNGSSFENLKSETLPHGYTSSRSGIKFIPIGSNSRNLITSFIPAQPVFMKLDYSRPQSYLAATIGKSQLLVSIDRSNYYTLTYTNSKKIAFSADIDPANSKNLLLSTMDSVLFSSNHGKSWKEIK